jgi:xanthine dehydrogenase molybdopterin-binding subunit B
MTVHSSSQNPFFTRRYVADVLGVPLNRVRLIQETLGGTFGGKEEASASRGALRVPVPSRQTAGKNGILPRRVAYRKRKAPSVRAAL